MTGPVYVTFAIDRIDPPVASGTGTPEIAGLSMLQVRELMRGVRGLTIVGCDLADVSPPYDLSGNTTLTGANLPDEMLCILLRVTCR